MGGLLSKDSKQDLVSIVMPAFMASKYIDSAIQSVRSQKYQNWELIVVDDGSKDDTADIVKYYAVQDTRIRLIKQQNSGPAIARQTAINFSSGRFIAFLDSDDEWLPEKLNLQLDFMKTQSSCFSYTEFRRISSDGSKVGMVIKVPKVMNYRKLLSNTAIATSTVILDRHKIGQITMTNAYYDDYVLWLGILRSGGCVALGLNEDLMRYRVVCNSVSRNKVRSSLMVWLVYRQIERLGFFYSIWCFIGYAFHATLKYKNF
jgi:teichuronic acid biosynthesis glycosyltransferase TuaG